METKSPIKPLINFTIDLLSLEEEKENFNQNPKKNSNRILSIKRNEITLHQIVLSCKHTIRKLRSTSTTEPRYRLTLSILAPVKGNYNTMIFSKKVYIAHDELDRCVNKFKMSRKEETAENEFDFANKEFQEAVRSTFLIFHKLTKGQITAEDILERSFSNISMTQSSQLELLTDNDNSAEVLTFPVERTPPNEEQPSTSHPFFNTAPTQHIYASTNLSWPPSSAWKTPSFTFEDVQQLWLELDELDAINTGCQMTKKPVLPKSSSQISTAQGDVSSVPEEMWLKSKEAIDHLTPEIFEEL